MRFLEELKDTAIKAGEGVRLSCLLSDEKYTTWWKNGKQIPGSSQRNKEPVHVIKKASIVDGGKYSCKVSANEQVETSCSLTVNGGELFVSLLISCL